MEIPFASDTKGSIHKDFTFDEEDFDKPTVLKFSLMYIIDDERVIKSKNYNIIKELIKSDNDSNNIIAYYLIKEI